MTTHVDKLLTIDWYGVIDAVLTQIIDIIEKVAFATDQQKLITRWSQYILLQYTIFTLKKTSRIIFTHAGTTIMSRSLFDTAHKINGIPFSIPRWWHHIFKLLDPVFIRGREGKVVIKQFYQAYTTWWMQLKINI